MATDKRKSQQMAKRIFQKSVTRLLRFLNNGAICIPHFSACSKNEPLNEEITKTFFVARKRGCDIQQALV